MTYRLRRAPPQYIEDDWSDLPPAVQDQQPPHPQQSLNRRKYIDPWDLENYEYIQRTALSSPEHLLHMTPSPAGEPIASTFYYVPGGEEQQNQHAPQHAIEARTPTANGPTDANMMDMMMMNMMMDDCNNNGGGGGLERFDYTTGCYAGLDEELFYNAKYESIHDEPAYSMYYTDIDTASSSNERTSSCGSSSVSTLQLHTPGFGVRASGRRSIVLPKPEPHIEFPPAPPPHEYYTTAATTASSQASPSAETQQQQPPEQHQHAIDASRLTDLQSSIYGDQASTAASYATLMRQHSTMPRHRPSIIVRRHAEHDDRNDHQLQLQHNVNVAQRYQQQQQQQHHLPHHEHLMHGHDDDDAHLPYCSLSNCYACVPEHVPVYAISNPATLMRGRSGRRFSAKRAMGIDENEADNPAASMLVLPPAVPPNNFGLSKRGLLQIDYSFNWNNLYRFISSGGH